jgi:16S rRNA (adenine1518-N6/adenine1519-N6)-dimethyltransferase
VNNEAFPGYNAKMGTISTLFEEFSYRPRKSAGQNFLTDSKIQDQIEQAVQCPPGDVLLEVGGGYGVLTERLVKKGSPLVVVEPDHKLFAMLERRFGKTPNISLIKADILRLDLNQFRPLEPAKITVVGNIPYYLTTPLLTRLLAQYHPFLRRIYFMVQKEVADRMMARPGTKAYGALTLCAQYYAPVRKLLDVPARCFKPRPKVDSAFIELEIRSQLPLNPEEERRFFALVRAIFQSRRKVLSNSLKLLGKPPERVGEALKKVNLDSRIRGEELDMEKLIELSKALT